MLPLYMKRIGELRLHRTMCSASRGGRLRRLKFEGYGKDFYEALRSFLSLIRNEMCGLSFTEET